MLAAKLPAHPTRWSPAVLLLGALAAQSPDALKPRRADNLKPLTPPHRWCVPIHGDELDGPSDYGTWAAGTSYKASFHDGFCFYPVLGDAAPRNLSVRWRTTAVRVGDQPIGDLSARPNQRRVDDHRFEYQWPCVVEAYEVRHDGVEQTFTVERYIPGGDLVVDGHLQSELDCAATPPQHGNLALCDSNGRDIVRYGAAFAVDAGGRRLPITTSIDNSGCVSLRVPESFLADANYPVTIDPLISSEQVAATSYTFVDTDVAFSPSNNRCLVLYERAHSSGDHDVYAVVTDNNLDPIAVLFSRTSLDWETHGSVAVVEEHNKWILAIEERAGGETGAPTVRVHVADTTATCFSNVMRRIGLTSQRWSRPAVGGSRSGRHALIVCEEEAAANSNTTNVRMVTFDVTTQLPTNSLPLAPSGTQLDFARPSINKISAGTQDGWALALQVWSNAQNDRWRVEVRRIGVNLIQYGVYRAPTTNPSRHDLSPRIAGSSGEYLLGYARQSVLQAPGRTEIRGGEQLYTAQLTWFLTNIVATTEAHGDFLTFSGESLRFTSIAFDSCRWSYWMSTIHSENASQLLAALAGHSGGLVADDVISLNGQDAAVAFDKNRCDYVIASAERSNPSTVEGNLWRYPTLPTLDSFGNRCGSATASASDYRPGSEHFIMFVEDAPPGAVCGFAFANDVAAPITLPGTVSCYAMLDPAELLGSVLALASADGDAVVAFPLPDRPVWTGEFAFQVFYLDEFATPLGIGLTRARRVRVVPM